MKRSLLCSLPCLLVLSLSLPSQVFTNSAVTSTPLTVTCSVPGHTSVVNTVPAGTPAGAVWLMPALYDYPTGTAVANIDGQYLDFESSLELGVSELVSATGAGTTTLAPHDYTMTLQAAVPTPVLLSIYWTLQMDANQTMPLVQVDIGDDGIVDFQGFGTGQAMTIPLVIGTAPFRVRTHTAMSASQGQVSSYLSCRVTPNLGVTATAQPGTGCLGGLNVVTTFQHELVLRMSIPVGLQWMVIGFSTTSVQLPWSTCLLTTAPDIVLPVSQGGPPPVQGELRIDLVTAPPGPFTFFAQGLVLIPTAPNPLYLTTRTNVVVH